ncbi:MAG: hypothetical protein LQ342_005029 [Letrouitia transgressa]|nr:MAG: hypothetical protein LQ342_005029 [Letrouitia transgressa]
MTDQQSPVKIAPPPWKCKYTAYIGSFYLSASSGLPRDIAYDPAEVSSATVTDTLKWKGGICMIQLLRYSYSPVGQYDEMILIPGNFALPSGESHTSITRIYVSQRDTCYNGRKNWNIPKHLARFEYTNSISSPPFSVSLFPHDDPSSNTPFFTASVAPLGFWTPSFPFSSKFTKYLGLSNVLLQPPLPEGKDKEIEPGTEEFLKTEGDIFSKSAKIVWFDMKQPGGGKKGDDGKDRKNWWPGLGRWHLGIWLKEAELNLGPPDAVKV